MRPSICVCLRVYLRMRNRFLGASVCVYESASKLACVHVWCRTSFCMHVCTNHHTVGWWLFYYTFLCLSFKNHMEGEHYMQPELHMTRCWHRVIFHAVRHVGCGVINYGYFKVFYLSGVSHSTVCRWPEKECRHAQKHSKFFCLFWTSTNIFKCYFFLHNCILHYSSVIFKYLHFFTWWPATNKAW